MSQNIYILVDGASMSLDKYKNYIGILCNIVVKYEKIETDENEQFGNYIAVLSIIETFLDVDEDEEGLVLKITADTYITEYKTDDTQKKIIEEILRYIKKIIDYMNLIQGDNYTDAYEAFCNYLFIKKHSKDYAREFIQRNTGSESKYRQSYSRAQYGQYRYGP